MGRIPGAFGDVEAVLVIKEWEHRDALREGRRAVGTSRLAEQMAVVSPSDIPEAHARPTGISDRGEASTDAFGSYTEKPPRSWWQRFFGF